MQYSARRKRVTSTLGELQPDSTVADLSASRPARPSPLVDTHEPGVEAVAFHDLARILHNQHPYRPGISAGAIRGHPTYRIGITTIRKDMPGVSMIGSKTVADCPSFRLIFTSETLPTALQNSTRYEAFRFTPT